MRSCPDRIGPRYLSIRLDGRADACSGSNRIGGASLFGMGTWSPGKACLLHPAILILTKSERCLADCHH
jgi:hypothetical protein